MAKGYLPYEVDQQLLLSPDMRARQLVPMAEAITRNVGELAETTSADAGYLSKEAVPHPSLPNLG